MVFNRLFGMHVSGKDLSDYELNEGNRAVKISDDPRQKLCTQCHAPDFSQQIGSHDD